jgi:hypothetical protein
VSLSKFGYHLRDLASKCRDACCAAACILSRSFLDLGLMTPAIHSPKQPSTSPRFFQTSKFRCSSALPTRAELVHNRRSHSSCLTVEAQDWAGLERSYRNEASKILQGLLSPEQNSVRQALFSWRALPARQRDATHGTFRCCWPLTADVPCAPARCAGELLCR